jgi:hypothetical protein
MFRDFLYLSDNILNLFDSVDSLTWYSNYFIIQFLIIHIVILLLLLLLLLLASFYFFFDIYLRHLDLTTFYDFIRLLCLFLKTLFWNELQVHILGCFFYLYIAFRIIFGFSKYFYYLFYLRLWFIISLGWYIQTVFTLFFFKLLFFLLIFFILLLFILFFLLLIVIVIKFHGLSSLYDPHF